MDPLSGNPHFAPPIGPIRGQPTVNPRRKFAELREPPSLIPLPSSLSEDLNRKCPFTPTHTLSVHVLPAAFPRAPSTPGQIIVPPPEYFASEGKSGKEERKQWIQNTAEAMYMEGREVEKFFPDPALGIKASEVGIWSTVLRIRRNQRAIKEGGKGITLIATHPIGFHKEIWEPTFKHIIEITEASSSIRIEEIWSLEAVNHGDAALINGIHIPKLPDRSDYGRDIANFLIYHLPDGRASFGREITFQLPRLPQSTTSSRINTGYLDRQVIAMGHSLGGDAVAVCGISYPKIFSTLILMETTLFPPSNNRTDRKLAILTSTLGRRSSWPSREEAKKALLKSPLFQAFDPSVLDVYIKYGLYKNSTTGEVHLKCYPALEASEYTPSRTMNEGWELLPTLDDRIELRWVMGGLDEASYLVGGIENARLTVWRRPTNASNVRIPGGGHLVVQEKPKEVAKDVALFLKHKYAQKYNNSKL